MNYAFQQFNRCRGTVLRLRKRRTSEEGFQGLSGCQSSRICVSTVDAMQNSDVSQPEAGTGSHFPKHIPAQYSVAPAGGDRDTLGEGEDTDSPLSELSDSRCSRLHSRASGEETTAAGSESPRRADDDPDGALQPSLPGQFPASAYFRSSMTSFGELHRSSQWDRKPCLQVRNPEVLSPGEKKTKQQVRYRRFHTAVKTV